MSGAISDRTRMRLSYTFSAPTRALIWTWEPGEGPPCRTVDGPPDDVDGFGYPAKATRLMLTVPVDGPTRVTLHGYVHQRGAPAPDRRFRTKEKVCLMTSLPDEVLLALAEAAGPDDRSWVLSSLQQQRRG